MFSCVVGTSVNAIYKFFDWEVACCTSQQSVLEVMQKAKWKRPRDELLDKVRCLYGFENWGVTANGLGDKSTCGSRYRVGRRNPVAYSSNNREC